VKPGIIAVVGLAITAFAVGELFGWQWGMLVCGIVLWADATFIGRHNGRN